ncbi:hypothetical protein DWW69_09685 [Bacteroides sp. AF16-49]|uniref:hypothetical protein n=1 Tax=Bacteroides sp. AF16-49 TaxID=2292192 RepID=UPI000EFFCF7B|nr:hypothetical protein [Bacteroides sp. AF16-49]RHR75551.1 hypothetical protein DWW69_09685 [Bacteroides sp. AF16-49]
MRGLSFYDKQHIQKVLAQQNTVANIFNRFILSITPFLQQWADRSSDNVWLRNQVVEKCVDRELDNLQSLLLANISAFNIDAWKRSEMKNEDFITEYIKGMAIDSVRKQGMFATNKDALLQLRKGFDARGNNLSPMVWNLADQTKMQLEFYLQTGLSVGRSATQIGQDLRQILNEPDRRFRRIRDKDGKLVMSQPMKDYHPGQGTYRSSKMNALRLTATSTNMAYRTADYERWSQQDFVIGIAIQRSANNKGPCKICDAMCGEYPKTFKFTGFHPFCICFATPKVLDPDEFADFLLNETIPQDKIITDIPPAAREFIDNNQAELQSAFWYQDNFIKERNSRKELFPQLTKPEVIKVTKTIRTKTELQKSDIQKRWDERVLYNKIASTENEIRMNKKFETGIVFDNKGKIVIDKRGASYSVSFTQEECKKMKDAIMTHNHPRGWGYPEKSLARIGNSFSPADIYLAVTWDLAEMRAVTPNYTFSMKRPQSGWGMPYEKVKNIIESENKKLRKEFDKRIDDNTLTVSQASAMHFHILWKRVSEKCGWNYSKAKTR